MSVFYDAARDRWVAQVGGFTTTPKKRSRFADSEHDARIAEHALRVERDELKEQAQAERQAKAVDGYCTDATEFQLIYWVKYVGETRWRNQGDGYANALRVCKRTDPYTDIRQIDLAWLESLVVLLRETYNQKDPTIRNCLSAMSVVLTAAVRKGALKSVPLLPDGLEKSPKNELIPEDSWVEMLISELGSHSYCRKTTARSIQLFVRFLRLSGCRTKEGLRLQWSDVSFSRGEFYLRKTKNGKPHKLPMWPEMEAVFIELKKLNSQQPFPFSYSLWWEHFTTAKGKVCSHLRLGESIRSAWVGHRFRAMCLTEKADLGWDAFAIKDWANHSSLQQSQHYVAKSTKRFDRLRDLMSSQPAQQMQPVATQPQPTQPD